MNKKDLNFNYIEKIFLESSELAKNSSYLSSDIIECVNIIIKSLKKGKKIILFGNGGSAADAQHIASEFIGRFNLERKSLPAIALTTDSSILTSLSNDYSFETVFERQCESLVSKGDIIFGISTSGNSKNVLNGLKISKKLGGITIGLLGNEGGKIKKIVDYSLIVNSKSTPRIQEVHIIVSHLICDLVEKNVGRKN
jgi:D-sedoheptulose 7-phosphate isomerase